MNVCHKKNDLLKVVRVTITAHSTGNIRTNRKEWKRKTIAHCPMHNGYVNNV